MNEGRKEGRSDRKGQRNKERGGEKMEKRLKCCILRKFANVDVSNFDLS